MSERESCGLKALRGFIFDMDGVIYLGGTVLPGAISFTKRLREAGVPFVYLTNNGTTSPAKVAERLERMGIPSSPEEVLTSALATAEAIAAEYRGGRVLVVGEDGIRSALVAAGFTLTEDHADADVVVASMDRQCTYARLREATLAIRRGAPFFATNTDRSFPSEQGLVPGAGALVGAIELASDVKPQVIGKPEPAFFDFALRRLGTEPGCTAAVGDRPDTDILGAQRAGVRTIAVLTGVGTRADFASMDVPPEWVFGDLSALEAAYFG